jgi:sec-independent protein translocase protein TatA
VPALPMFSQRRGCDTGEFGLIWKLLLVLAIVLLIFGSTRLPTLARSFGESIIEFKKGIKGIEDQSEDKKET